MLNLYSNSKSKSSLLRCYYIHGINLLPNIVVKHECDAMKKHYKITIKYFLESQFGERYHPLKCKSITRSCQVEAHGIKLLVDKFCDNGKQRKKSYHNKYNLDFWLLGKEKIWQH